MRPGARLKRAGIRADGDAVGGEEAVVDAAPGPGGLALREAVPGAAVDALVLAPVLALVPLLGGHVEAGQRGAAGAAALGPVGGPEVLQLRDGDLGELVVAVAASVLWGVHPFKMFSSHGGVREGATGGF